MIRPAQLDAKLDEVAEESVTLAEAARRLGCAVSTVRQLLADGILGGHRVGKGDRPRGVRVHAASIRRYKAHHAIAPGARSIETPAPAPRPAASSGALEARRRLRELGML
jgi:excisionase family DNA binding protein